MKKIFLAMGAATLTASAIAQTVVTFKPDATTGQDANIWQLDGGVVPSGYSATPATLNFGNDIDNNIGRWTWNGDPGTDRFLIRFVGLNSLPAGAIITSATLTFHTPPTTAGWGNSYFPGSPLPLTNNGWIKRVQPGSVSSANNWNEQTVTWNTQPAVDPVAANWAPLPLTTSRWNYDVSVDVTAMTQAIVTGLLTDPNANNGFMVALDNESTYYRGQDFASSDNPDCAYWPELTVKYEVKRIAAAQSVSQMDQIGRQDEPTAALLKKQVDLSGSNIVSISPNPATSGWNIKLSAPQESSVSITIYDVAGKVVGTSNENVHAGTNDIYQAADRLASGLYFIEVKGAGISAREKVVKQ